MNGALDGTPGLTFYPERDLTPDMELTRLLPAGPLLGISITGQKAMTDAVSPQYPPASKRC